MHEECREIRPFPPSLTNSTQRNGRCVMSDACWNVCPWNPFIFSHPAHIRIHALCPTISEHYARVQVRRSVTPAIRALWPVSAGYRSRPVSGYRCGSRRRRRAGRVPQGAALCGHEEVCPDSGFLDPSYIMRMEEAAAMAKVQAADAFAAGSENITWSCGACTLQNAGALTHCAVCRTPRGASEPVEPPVSRDAARADAAKMQKAIESVAASSELTRDAF